jgi:hypothetical protein
VDDGTQQSNLLQRYFGYVPTQKKTRKKIDSLTSMYPGTSDISRMIWRPQFLDESVDGAPLATTISQIFQDFDYDRLPDNPAVAIWMRPGFVAAAILFYLVSIPLLRFVIEKVLGCGYGFSKTDAFRNAVAAHNFALAVFSFLCAWNVSLIAMDNLVQRGFTSTYCDVDGEFWGKGGLGAWATAFYISKYYEFIDTWILIAKGKDASFLQVYHHAGIAFIFWAAVASQGAWVSVRCVY